MLKLRFALLVLTVLLNLEGLAQHDILKERVTIHFTGETVIEALSRLSEQTGYTINYSLTQIPERLVKKNFQNEELREIIQEIWGAEELDYRVVGSSISLIKTGRREKKATDGRIFGRITDAENEPLPFATVGIKGTTQGVITDESGLFEIASLEEGYHTLAISSTGYLSHEVRAFAKSGSATQLQVALSEAVNTLDEVVVEGTSIAKEISLEPIKINTIDAADFRIQSVGAAEMLKIAPGVLVRRSGGLGSAARVNINGLQGNAVGIYVDGFPVEYLGGGYNLNNLPGSVIDRLEVYKGVVPADKSTDALGGAVNIVSKRLYNDALELSYQVGSFNTHRATFLGSKRIKNHLSVTLEGYHNYSDNDFLMGNVRNTWLDSIPNKFFPAQPDSLIASPREDTLRRVRRFHNAHRSSFVQAGLHWNDLRWADQLSFTSNFSSRFDEVQSLSITEGFALFGRTSETVAFNQSLTYAKAFMDETLELRYKGVISNSRNGTDRSNLDKFNWEKEIIERNASDSLDIEQTGLSHAHRLGITYQINERNRLSLNNFYARTRSFRKDKIDPFFEAFGELINGNEIPSFFTKNIASIEWTSDWLEKKFTSTVFGKQYFYRAETAVRTTDGTLEVEDQTTGYGGALKYVFTEHFFIRSSYEYAVRIPTEREVYGDFVNVNPNFSLRPERSHNVNLGITYEKTFEKLFRIHTSLDGFIRNTRDLIWLVPVGTSSQFRNNRQVRSLGMEWSLRVIKDDHSNIEYNLTQQERTYLAFNEEILVSQYPSFIGSPFPNTPTFFHNVQLNLGIKSFKSTLPNIVVYGSWFHVKEFSITDEPPNGEPEPFSLVPVQNEFNLGLGYFSPDTKLNLSFQVNNLTNDLALFDNWRVPKPNRNFQFKVNYQIF
ncbi:MAG: carboxypeptidase-like regulatory domain-containing protein [Bacteroidota bacterium]